MGAASQSAGRHLVMARDARHRQSTIGKSVAFTSSPPAAQMPIGGLLGSRPIQTLLAPGDAYHSTAAVLSSVDAIASTCAASIEVSSVGTAGEWPLKLVKLGADAPSKRRVLLTFGMHGREYQSAEIGLALLTELCSGSERSNALLSRVAFAVFPLLNPVGRSRTDAEYSTDTPQLSNQQCADRRKNGRLVDINRNFRVGHPDLLADWAGSDAASKPTHTPHDVSANTLPPAVTSSATWLPSATDPTSSSPQRWNRLKRWSRTRARAPPPSARSSRERRSRSMPRDERGVEKSAPP